MDMMNILRKAKNAVKIFREDGFNRIVFILATEYSLPIPLSTKSRWKAGIKSEIQYWDAYFRTQGLQWTDTYKLRFNPDLPLQPRPASLLPSQSEIHILDVGAGPLTWLGKKHEGENVNITAVDPLADEYDKILAKYHIEPLVRTRKLTAENLTKKFSSDTFGLVFARNCIDHSYNPETAILQMIDVTKSGGYVLLEHRPNEAENENYQGLHQWNFSMSSEGDFLVSSKSDTVNMTRKYAEICTMTSEIVYEFGEVDWLIVKIQKK
jgi:SAM-dependent methyltransferase